MHDGRGAGESLAAATEIAADIRHVFGGHVHRQMLYYQGQGRACWSLCQRPVPRFRCRRIGAGSPPSGPSGNRATGDREAMYALFDRDAARLTFARVAYDHAAAAAAIRAAGLPDFCRKTFEGSMKLLEPGETLDGFVVKANLHSGAWRTSISSIRQRRARSRIPDGDEGATHGDRRRRREHRRLRGRGADPAGAVGPHVPRFVAAGDLTRCPIW